jgi:hypothetical protein
MKEIDEKIVSNMEDIGTFTPVSIELQFCLQRPEGHYINGQRGSYHRRPRMPIFPTDESIQTLLGKLQSLKSKDLQIVSVQAHKQYTDVPSYTRVCITALSNTKFPHLNDGDDDETGDLIGPIFAEAASQTDSMYGKDDQDDVFRIVDEENIIDEWLWMNDTDVQVCNTQESDDNTSLEDDSESQSVWPRNNHLARQTAIFVDLTQE